MQCNAMEDRYSMIMHTPTLITHARERENDTTIAATLEVGWSDTYENSNVALASIQNGIHE